MTWHPLLLSVLAVDALSLLLVAAAAVSAIRILTAGSPKSAGAAQSPDEGETGTASVRGRIGLALFALSTLVLIVGITGILPKIVQGAMCATGVLQATQGSAGRALALRGLALGLLAAWHLLDRLNRGQPDSPLATVAARSLLLASPTVFLAVYDTFRAILRLDVHRPVDCCSVVYDQIRSASEAGGTWAIPDVYWIWGLALGGTAIIFLGVHLWRSSRQQEPRQTGLIFLVTVFWVPVAATALVRSLAAYHYGVLQHRCPWCLFLPEHGLVGYLLFGTLLLVAVEAGAAFICSKVAAGFPVLESDTRKRSRGAGWRITAATVLFLALSGLPPIMWRFRFGVWMG